MKVELTDMACAVARRATRLGLSVAEFAARPDLVNELILDGTPLDAATIALAARWQQGRGKVQPSAPKRPVSEASPPRTPAEKPRRASTGKGKYVIMGFASLGVIHWLGQQGFSLDAAKKVLAHFGITSITDENLAYRLRAGASPARSKPAPLSDAQKAELRKLAGG